MCAARETSAYSLGVPRHPKLPCTVAKADVMGSIEANCRWRIETGWATVVHGARPATDVVDTRAAVCHLRRLRGAGGEVFGGIEARNGVADESEVRISGLEPLKEVFVTDDVDFGLLGVISESLRSASVDESLQLG